MLKRSITDHRGNNVRLYGVRDELARMESRDDVPRAITRRIDERLRKPREIADWVTAGAITLVCLAVSMRLTPAVYKSGLGWYVWIPLVAIVNVAICVSIALARRWIFHRSYAAEIVAAFLGERRCPACGYDLAGAKPADDGFTVCPECGAAWNVETERAPSASSG